VTAGGCGLVFDTTGSAFETFVAVCLSGGLSNWIVASKSREYYVRYGVSGSSAGYESTTGR